MHRFLLAIGLALMAGGCISSPGSPPPTSSTDYPPPAPSITIPPPTLPTPEASGSILRGTDCSMGIDTFIQSPVPVGTAPPGWEYHGPFGNQVYVRAMECERLSAFPLERGPVRIVFEGHQNFTAPANCQDN